MEKITGDMYFAALLLAYGAEILRVDQSDRFRQKFYFTGVGQGGSSLIREIYKLEGIVPIRIEKPDFETIENLFTCGKLMFPPNYPESLRRIKTRIHSTGDKYD